MRFKHYGWFLLAFSVLVFSKAGISQVVPQANAGSGLAIKLGAGVSSFDVDWGHGRMLGGTLWADWHPKQISGKLYGLGIEAEARDISFNRSPSQVNFRQDTAGGGVIYNWPHYRKFRPYGKFLVSFGSMDFKIRTPYSHDTRVVFAPGVGFDYRMWGPIWFRADYEYQFWETLLGHTPDPQGFTLGAAYAFGSRRGR